MTGTGADERRAAVEAGLTPIVRIAGHPTHWTVDERLAHYECPGVAVAVMHEGRIDWAAGYGRRNVDAPESVGADTLFMVASCSKPVAAVLVLQQVERGVLDVDVDVNRYLRRWQVPMNDFTAERPVTLRHCLSHTAGLSVNGWGAVPQDGSPVATTLDLLDGTPPSSQPPVVVNKAYDGTSRYSGGGYVISQLVLEDVLGVDFADLADRMIFDPLGMRNTTYRQPLPTRFHGDVAAGHGDDGRPFPGGWLLSSEKAAGGLFSTARDYATFLLGVRAAWQGETGAILGQGIAREMMTRHDRGEFGLGVRVLGNGPTRFNHGGSNDGYQSETNTYLESGDGAVVLTNSTSGIFLYREVHNGVAEVYGWPDFLLAPKRLRTLTPDDMQAYVGSYRIKMGIELPFIEVWVDNGRLFSQVPGLRFGVQETFCDEAGVLFQQTGPFETRVEFGPDGLAQELIVSEAGVDFLRAERVEP
jgi:CubicO group peptidase (beta-lactamase class C family)